MFKFSYEVYREKLKHKQCKYREYFNIQIKNQKIFYTVCARHSSAFNEVEISELHSLKKCIKSADIRKISYIRVLFFLSMNWN